jgi:hypothetical protein
MSTAAIYFVGSSHGSAHEDCTPFTDAAKLPINLGHGKPEIGTATPEGVRFSGSYFEQTGSNNVFILQLSHIIL